MLKLTICAFLLLIAAVSLVEMHEESYGQGTLSHRGHRESLSRKDVSNVDPVGQVHKKYKRNDHSGHYHPDSPTPNRNRTRHPAKTQKKSAKQSKKLTKKAKETRAAEAKHARNAKKLHKKH